MTNPSNDDVLDAQHDTGVPHDRTQSGGMPRVGGHSHDDLMAAQADKDRAAAGLGEDQVRPAT